MFFLSSFYKMCIDLKIRSLCHMSKINNNNAWPSRKRLNKTQNTLVALAFYK